MLSLLRNGVVGQGAGGAERLVGTRGRSVLQNPRETLLSSLRGRIEEYCDHLKYRTDRGFPVSFFAESVPHGGESTLPEGNVLLIIAPSRDVSSAGRVVRNFKVVVKHTQTDSAVLCCA